MLTKKNAYVVLYFIGDFVPTEEEQIDASQFGPYCRFRNATYIDPTAGCEPCTAVAGQHVPANYARTYPRAVSISDFYAGKLPVVAARNAGPSVADLAGAAEADGAIDLPIPPEFAAMAAGEAPELPALPPADWTPNS